MQFKTNMGFYLERKFPLIQSVLATAGDRVLNRKKNSDQIWQLLHWNYFRN